MYFNIVQSLVCKNDDEALPSIILAGRALLLKMPITLEPHAIFYTNFAYLCMFTLSSHWYEKSDQASSSTILAGQALSVKLFITLESRGAFGLKFEYLCILTLSRLHRASFWLIELL